MQWRGRRQSSNVEDRRGISGKGIAVGGGLLGIIIVVVNLLMGGDGQQLPIPNTVSTPLSAEEQARQDSLAEFVKVVLAETEDVWHEVFQKSGSGYQEPKLVLFNGSVQSSCGFAESATGPFYCPGDNNVYIDLSFYQELQDRFKAGGDFAMAYVIAHEVGHHVQNLLGKTREMAQLRQRLSAEEYNRYSVKLELQADFYAGLWAHYVQGKGLLEAGDIEEALRAAHAIGDDRLQMEAQGYVVPEAFTHGTSEERMYWFRRGFETGDPRQGDTFSDPRL
jgi:Predicted metalloprotease